MLKTSIFILSYTFRYLKQWYFLPFANRLFSRINLVFENIFALGEIRYNNKREENNNLRVAGANNKIQSNDIILFPYSSRLPFGFANVYSKTSKEQKII